MDPMLEGASWLDEELAGSTFADARLGQRLRRLLEQLGGAMGASLPLACQDWAATKAAYRFFDNDRVSEAQLLAGHFAATASRVAVIEGPILILHDTIEFDYHRVRPEPIGLTGQYPCRNTTYDRRQFYTICGSSDAQKPRCYAGRVAAGTVRDQVLDPRQLQGHEHPQAAYQPNARAHPAEREPPLAREHAPGISTCCPIRRGAFTSVIARATSLSLFRHGARTRHALSRAQQRRPAGG